MRIAVCILLAVGSLGLLLDNRQISATYRNTPATATIAGPVYKEAIAYASGRVPALGQPVGQIRSSVRTANENGALGSQSISSQVRRDVVALPARFTGVPMPTSSLSFPGLANYDNIAAFSAVIIPPDTIGDVGPNHYVQAVNALARVFDKLGSPLTSPFKLSELFAPLGTACSVRDDGQPIVLYDPLADRWLLSNYCNNFPPFRQLIAISKTGDAAGEYHLYEFAMPNIRLNDAAKIGVWPDGYYMSTEEFTGSDFSGAGAFAFDRAKMLRGEPDAGYVYFQLPSTSTVRRGNLLPSDLDGLRPPPASSPNIFVGYSATEYGEPRDSLRLYDFAVDFTAPHSSRFVERAESPLEVAAFDPTSPDGRTDIAQPRPGERLDANSDRLNYRVAYRNLGSVESLVLNQTVRTASEPYRAGVRLYELRRTGQAFSVVEQLTIASPAESRWIGSAAQDHQGNLAVGYNHVADDKPPSLHYTGKLASEPAGTFREEGKLIEGTGVQRAFGFRWGDYSGMSVDPTDDCTFWMTGEYYTLESQNFSDFTWLTRIGKFKFPECTPAPRSVIRGSIRNAATNGSVAGATVTASSHSRTSTANGSFGDLVVVPGQYQITASAAGYASRTVSVNVIDGQTLVQDFVLEPVAALQPVRVDISSEGCISNGAADPGEQLTVEVPIRNIGAAATQNLVVSLVASRDVASPGPPQVYGVLAAGGPEVSREFTFTVSLAVVCGARIELTFALSDAGRDLGVIRWSFQTGTSRIALKENFDRTQAGALPARWTRNAVDSQSAGQRNWRVSNARSQSPPKSVFSPDLNQVGINELVTPAFHIVSQGPRLTFRNWYELESTFLRNRLFDGSVLEIRIGDNEWRDIIAAGGRFVTGGYDGLIDSCCQNPLAARAGWSGRSGIHAVPEFITSEVIFPDSAAGQIVQLRWRVGTDIGGLREGQYVDDVLVTDGFACSCTR